MTDVYKTAAYIPVSAEMLDDYRNFRPTWDRAVGDMIFRLAVGRDRVNPNPMPRIRIFF